MADAIINSTRATEPDRDALLAALRSTVDPTIGIRLRTPGDPYVLKKNTDWTPAQIAAVQSVIDTAPATTPQLVYQRRSREKDVLATMAMIVRARNIAAWNAMTLAQKIAATQAEADVWVNIREFVEANV